MSIQNVYNSSTYATLWDLTQQNQNAKNAQEGKNAGTSGTSGTSANGANQQTKNPYATSSADSLSSLLGAVQGAMDDLGLASNDKVTFRTLMAHKTKLEAEFYEASRQGLLKAGVDEKADFRLVSGKNGGVEVITSHPDKEKIEKFFKDNPKLVEKFEKIQGLANIEESRKNQKIDVDAIRSRIQAESMTAWFAASPSPSIMDFQYGGANFMTGINKIA